MIRNVSTNRNDYVRFIGMNVRGASLLLIGEVKDVEIWHSTHFSEEVMFRLDNDETFSWRQIAKIGSEILLNR